MKYNDDIVENIYALEKDDRALDSIPTTDISSVENGSKEVLFVPNLSNNAYGQNKRRNRLSCKFSSR